MADIPLAHLSRPELVHLLLRIVDLLSQPVMPCHSAAPGTATSAGPPLELYDASLDPWNAPDTGPAAAVSSAGCGGPARSCGTIPHVGLLNPSATAFYPVVSGPPAYPGHSGCPGLSAELPRFGPYPKVDRLVPQSGHAGGCCGGMPQPGFPGENALPVCGPWVHVCGSPCEVCGSPCVLQRAGHCHHLR